MSLRHPVVAIVLQCVVADECRYCALHQRYAVVYSSSVVAVCCSCSVAAHECWYCALHHRCVAMCKKKCCSSSVAV